MKGASSFAAAGATTQNSCHKAAGRASSVAEAGATTWNGCHEPAGGVLDLNEKAFGAVVTMVFCTEAGGVMEWSL